MKKKKKKGEMRGVTTAMFVGPAVGQPTEVETFLRVPNNRGKKAKQLRGNDNHPRRGGGGKSLHGKRKKKNEKESILGNGGGLRSKISYKKKWGEKRKESSYCKKTKQTKFVDYKP